MRAAADVDERGRAPGQRRGRAIAIILCVGAAVALYLPLSAPSASASQTNYTSPGSRIFVVPAGVTSIDFELIGGDGNKMGVTATTPNSRGADITATLAVTPGESLQIVVGGAGDFGRTTSAGAGGFNGGGAGGLPGADGGFGGGVGGGGGGGATDVRRGACA